FRPTVGPRSPSSISRTRACTPRSAPARPTAASDLSRVIRCLDPPPPTDKTPRMSKPAVVVRIPGAETTPADRPPLFDNWRQIIVTGNLPAGRAIDPVSRWLLITRACVFSMTITSGLIGGLLAAATAPACNWRLFALAMLGLVLAHATNNMIND